MNKKIFLVLTMVILAVVLIDAQQSPAPTTAYYHDPAVCKKINKK